MAGASSVSVGRLAWGELRMLCRGAGAPLLGLGVVAAMLIGLQTPRTMPTHEFFWPSMNALTTTLGGVAPLVWAIGRGDRADHLVVDPARTAIGWALGIASFGVLIAAAPILAVVTLQRISVDWVLLEPLFVVVPLAALGPALASIARRPAVAALVWTVLLLACIGIFGLGIPIPADSLGGRSKLPQLAFAIPAVLLTTVGGVFVSIGAMCRRQGRRVL